MILGFLLLVFFSNLKTNTPPPDLAAYRKLLDLSTIDKAVAEQFFEQTKLIKDEQAPIWVGFKAMSHILMSKYVFNPMTKLSHFNKGKKLLDHAISRAKNHPELLFFRFTTQSNIPSLLNYKSNLESDKMALIDHLKKQIQDKVLHARIKSYLLSTKYCSIQEKELIKKL